MRLHKRLPLTLLFLALGTLASSARAADEAEGYRLLGDLPVMDRGRVKPLHTLAIERVKLIHSRQTIKLEGPDGKSESWGPVAAFLDWTARPEFWADQEFILVEYLPLKHKLLAGATRGVLSTAASRESTSPADKAILDKLAVAEVFDEADLALALALPLPSLTEADREELTRYAHKLAADHKWLSPRDLEDAEIEVDGAALSLLEWFGQILEARGRGGMGGSVKLPEIDEKAAEVAERLVFFQAIRDGNVRGAPSLELNVLPRPHSEAYLEYIGSSLKDDVHTEQTEPTPLTRDGLAVLQTYLRDLQRKDRSLPGTLDDETLKQLDEQPAEVKAAFLKRHADFNTRFAEWLKEKSQWIPLRILLEADTAELQSAGIDSGRVADFRAAYAALIEAEKNAPNALPADKAQALLTAARQLGADVGPYPAVAAMSRESHYNRFSPFFRAPAFFGIALICFLLGLGIAAEKGSPMESLDKGIYTLGMAAFLGGIAIVAYGFYLRVRITGWAPVSGMEETVVWVAMVSALIGLVLEFVSRRRYPAMAGAGVALLATLLAANVPMLDPQIKALQPVLRSNYWLTIHVLTIVSSYAAFALALGLGLLAIGFYLTASYKRSASYAELLGPLGPGLPLVAVGIAGLVGSSQGWAPGTLDSNLAYYLSGAFTGLGGLLSIAAIYAAFGEFCNRAPRAAAVPGLALLATATPAVVMGMAEMGPKILATPTALYVSWIALIVGASWSVLALFGDLARRTLESARQRIVAQAGGQTASGDDETASEALATGSSGGVATLTRPSSVAEIRERLAAASAAPALDARTLSMQSTAARIKPITGFIYRAMQVGVLLCAAGTILGGVWADDSWGRFWGWDPKEVWALITLLVYLVPLHGRFAGWVNTFGLVVASVVCFLSVLMAWYGVNYVLGVGLHSYGFSEAGGQGIVMASTGAVLAIVAGTAWRRALSSRQVETPADA